MVRSAPTSAVQAALPSVRMSLPQTSPTGQAPGFIDFSMPYWYDLNGMRYVPKPVRSTPMRPPESSIQYSLMVWPWLSLPGVLSKSW